MNKAYYGFVSGLPVPSEGKTLEDGLKTFVDEVSSSLEPADYYQCLLLNYKYDIQNTIRLLSEDEHFDETANLSREELELIISKKQTEDRFFSSFLDEYGIPEEVGSTLDLERNLTQHFYTYISREGIPFLKDWVKFEVTLRNLTVVYTLRNLEIDSDDLYIEGGYFSGFELKRINVADLDRQYPFLKKKYEALEIKDPADRKLKVDQIKWEYLDEKVFFEPFSLSAILAHQLKLMDLKVWDTIDKEEGSKQLNLYLQQVKENLETQIS